MNIIYIYESVKRYIKERYGTKVWCYTDFFLDQDGFLYFKEELEADNEILPDMDDDEIIEHICDSLNSNMTIYTFQQTMLSI